MQIDSTLNNRACRRLFLVVVVLVTSTLLETLPVYGVEPGDSLVVTAPALNARPSPGIANAPRFVLPQGTLVSVTDVKGRWANTRSAYGSGWCHLDYLKPASLSGLYFEPLDFGYELTLSRENALKLYGFLRKHLGEVDVARFLARIARMRIDARIKLVAAAVAIDVLLFKRKLYVNMGRHGVTIRVWGPSALEGVIPPRQNLSSWLWWELFYKKVVPEDVQQEIDDAANKARSVTTVPVFWKIRPVGGPQAP